MVFGLIGVFIGLAVGIAVGITVSEKFRIAGLVARRELITGFSSAWMVHVEKVLYGSFPTVEGATWLEKGK